MKFLIIGLNFLVENPQAPWKILPPLVTQAPPRKKSTSPTLFKNASKILGLPCRKRGGEDTMATLTKGGFL